MDAGADKGQPQGPSGSKLPLPEEVLEVIFSYLSPLELSALTKTSRALHRIASSPHLWETAYYAFWREGDEAREQKRRTTVWRQRRRAEALRDLAMFSWNTRGRTRRARSSDGTLDGDEGKPEEQNGGEHSSGSRKAKQDESLAPFPKFLSSHPVQFDTEDFGQPPSFYNLFLERLAIDQEVLDVIEEQCKSDSGWLKRAGELVNKHGNDAKDVLHALVSSQLRRFDNPFDDEEDDDQHNAPSFPRAFALRRPGTVRSRSHHLTIVHYARELLEHLQVREAMYGLSSIRPRDPDIHSGSPPKGSSLWTSLAPTSDDMSNAELEQALESKQFETACSWLSMFRGGEGQEIAEELDVLATSCALFLRQGNISLEKDPTVFTLAIQEFMERRGFKGAEQNDFYHLDNNFLHLCLDESGRKALPLTLTVIFCSLACRLGLRAMLANVPGRILAFVELPAESEHRAAERFWVDIYGGGIILREDDIRRLLSRMHETPLDAAQLGLAASDAVTIALRAAKNILNSVQRMRTVPQILFAVEESSGGMAKDFNSGPQRRPAEDPSLNADQLFEKLAYAPNFVFSPRRTYLWRSSRSSPLGPKLCDPFWLDETEAITASGQGRHRSRLQGTDFDQTAAVHGAAHTLVRLGTVPDIRQGAAGPNWLASLAKVSFPLDVLVIEDELVGRRSSVVSSTPRPRGSGVTDLRSHSSQVDAATMGENANSPPQPPPEHSYLFNEQDEEAREMLAHELRGICLACQGEVSERDRKRRNPSLEDLKGGDLDEARSTPAQGTQNLDHIYSAGTVFVHRTYGYRAVIKSWDTKCSASENWIEQMGVRDLPGGDKQPFYSSIVDDGSTRYVAHCNIVPAVSRPVQRGSQNDKGSGDTQTSVSIGDEGNGTSSPHLLQSLQDDEAEESPRMVPSTTETSAAATRESYVGREDVERLLKHRGIGVLFRCVNTSALPGPGSQSGKGTRIRLVRNERGRAIFPDDCGDATPV